MYIFVVTQRIVEKKARTATDQDEIKKKEKKWTKSIEKLRNKYSMYGKYERIPMHDVQIDKSNFT